MGVEAGRIYERASQALIGQDPTDGTKANFALVTSAGLQASIGYHWNTSTLAYEVNTGGTATGGDVNVTNFPATQAISAASLPLPTGAATSALQTTGNASLSSIDGKTPALGQALAAASVPVVLTAAQLATLTPVSSVSVSSSALPSNAAQESGGNLATTVTTLAAIQALLNIAQGASSSGVKGQLIQALVSDGPESYLDNTLQPLSLTNEGGLRVSTTPALRDVEFFDDDSTPSLTANPAFIQSGWESALWG